MTLYQCRNCKATVLRFDEKIPRLCKKCGAGEIFMEPIRSDKEEKDEQQYVSING